MSTPIMSLEQFEFWVEGLDHPECVTRGPDGTTHAGGEAGQIYRISDEGKVEQIGSTGGFVLGICLDGAGNVYACDAGKRAVFRISQSGAVSTYSAGTSDRPMVNPNYPVFDRNGNLYVTDSGRWKKSDGCVFRIRPGGQAEVWSTAATDFPNGEALAGDGKSLYVVISLLPGVVQVPINADGSAGEPRPVVTLPRTIPDGLALDVHQNLYISCYTPDVIYRRSPSGQLDVLAEDWQHVMLSSPTNIAFCGPDRRKLVAASLGRWHLARADMPVAGQLLNYPQIEEGLHMHQRFKDKVAIVTGGGAGIGRASSMAFAKEGAGVIIADVDEKAGPATAKEIKDSGGRALFVRCDIGSSADVQAMVRRGLDEFGGIDVLHNNAGIQDYGTVVDMPEERWDRLMNINLRGSFLTRKYAIPHMKKRGGGAIVNTASVQAFASQRTVAAYSASKGAIVSFTKSVALDHAPDNIRCNCIAPGSVHTPMLEWAANLFAKDSPQQAINDWGKLHPLGRVARPEEVAALVLFLASDDSSFCTGACYTVDGGLLAALM